MCTAAGIDGFGRPSASNRYTNTKVRCVHEVVVIQRQAVILDLMTVGKAVREVR